MARRGRRLFSTHREPEVKTPQYPVTDGHVVTIDYSVFDDEGNMLDTTRDRGVLTYLHGSNMLPVGIQKAVEGFHAGDKVSDRIVPPEEGFGARDEEKIAEYEASLFADVNEIVAGQLFQIDTGEGRKIVTVVDVDDQVIKVDLNHPLAGATLHLDATIVSVRPATEEELTQGMVF